MKSNLLGILFVCLVAGPTIAAADTIENVSFTYTNPSSGNLTATGTLTVDVTTNQALSGSGTITSDLFVNAGGPPTPMGPRSFFLVTPGNCAATTAANKCSLGSGGVINNWTDSDGTNLSGDTSFNVSTAPYVSSAGLLFAVGNVNEHGTGGTYDSFNLWSNNASSWGEFLGAGGAALSAGGTQVSSNALGGGTLTIDNITPVPLPAALPLLLSGLGGFGALAARRRQVRLV